MCFIVQLSIRPGRCPWFHAQAGFTSGSARPEEGRPGAFVREDVGGSAAGGQLDGESHAAAVRGSAALEDARQRANAACSSIEPPR